MRSASAGGAERGEDEPPRGDRIGDRADAGAASLYAAALAWAPLRNAASAWAVRTHSEIFIIVEVGVVVVVVVCGCWWFVAVTSTCSFVKQAAWSHWSESSASI